MGKYILEILVILLIGLFLAPFVIGGVRRMTKLYKKSIDDVTKENGNGDETDQTK